VRQQPHQREHQQYHLERQGTPPWADFDVVVNSEALVWAEWVPAFVRTLEWLLAPGANSGGGTVNNRRRQQHCSADGDNGCADIPGSSAPAGRLSDDAAQRSTGVDGHEDEETCCTPLAIVGFERREARRDAEQKFLELVETSNVLRIARMADTGSLLFPGLRVALVTTKAIRQHNNAALAT
jgi:hypothetical protein